jgi:hypothetical protein
MFCPQCGTETTEPLKFCKKCGTNLRRVQGVMSKGGAAYSATEAKVGWEREGLEARRERRKRSPEEKRLNEIKGGVITSCVGLGLMIFLTFLFDAIAELTGPGVQGIMRAIPFAGIIPFLIGLGIIFNGLFISKRIVEVNRGESQRSETDRDEWRAPLFAAPNTTPVAQLGEPANYSIVEPTTQTLREPAPAPSPRDTN